MKNRRLKVAPKYASLYPALRVYSTLRLSGAWLLQAGFAPGDVAQVTITEAGQIVITRQAPGEPAPAAQPGRRLAIAQ